MIGPGPGSTLGPNRTPRWVGSERPRIRDRVGARIGGTQEWEAHVAGHNKWSQIKRKKAVNDAKRGKLFTKIIREITVAAREGGGSPEFNPRLRLAVDQAKAANMPAENVDRAIQRGTGELEGVSYEEIVYEGYAPGGVALYIETLTDNQNRTVAEVRHILDRNGGNLGTAGSVAWQFERQGHVYVPADSTTEEALYEVAIEAGASDVRLESDEYLVVTEPDGFHGVQDALKAAEIQVAQAEYAMVPSTEVDVAGKDAEKLIKLLDALDESDDVQKVYSNGNIDEAVLAEAM